MAYFYGHLQPLAFGAATALPVPGQGADAQSLMTPLGSILPLLAVLLTGCGNHPSVRAARPESLAVPVRTVAVSTDVKVDITRQ
jgi:hypothetical protein